MSQPDRPDQPDQSDLLKPYGEIDVLNLYAKLARYLTEFLKGREIASKTWIPTWIPDSKVPYFLNRAGKLGALWIEDFQQISDEFLKLGARHHLSQVKNMLSERQILLWRYFVPRKFSEFFYATNGEGRPIDRVFIDIDRTNLSAENSLEVVRLLLEIMEVQKKEDDEFNELVKSIAAE